MIISSILSPVPFCGQLGGGVNFAQLTPLDPIIQQILNVIKNRIVYLRPFVLRD